MQNKILLQCFDAGISCLSVGCSLEKIRQRTCTIIVKQWYIYIQVRSYALYPIKHNFLLNSFTCICRICNKIYIFFFRHKDTRKTPCSISTVPNNLYNCVHTCRDEHLIDTEVELWEQTNTTVYVEISLGVNLQLWCKNNITLRHWNGNCSVIVKLPWHK